MASLLRKVKNRLDSQSTAGFLIAAIVLGVLVGTATSALALLIDFVESASAEFSQSTGLGRWAVLALIPGGMFVSWLLNRNLGPGISGGGVSETMAGLSLHGGYLPTKQVIPKIVATAATLGTGGSGGREGPVVYIGAIIGSKLSRITNFDHDHIRSLVAAGAGAAIGASFNAPIAGMLFAMEVILGSFAIRHLNAVVIASVGAAVTADILIGQDLILTSPPHNLEDSRHLILYAILALLAVGIGIIYLRFEDRAANWRLPDRIPRWGKPLIYGSVVAFLGIIWPDSLGTGLGFLNGLLELNDAGSYVWWSLGFVALAKIVTSVLTREGGGSAGEFMASLVIGGSLGAAFAIVVQTFGNLDSIDVGAFTVVGMAAVLATIARAPLTSVILVFELTGNYELVLPLMLAAGLATYLSDRLHPESAYSAKLLRQGIRLPTSEDIDLLDTVQVETVMVPHGGGLHPWNTLAEAAEYFDVTTHHGAPVFDDQDRLVGMLTLSDVSGAGGPSMTATVADAMTRDVITITSDAPVASALARMASLGVGRLPVVATDDPRRVVGMFRRVSVVRAYEEALSMSKGKELYRERTRIRSQPGADFFDMKIVEESPLANRDVAHIPWPKDLVLVSVQRGTSVLVPHGDTIIRIGDRLTVFGTPEARDEILNTPHVTE
ncbi:MAG: chloride channel protein [Acidimicrobiia bacterium]